MREPRGEQGDEDEKWENHEAAAMAAGGFAAGSAMALAATHTGSATATPALSNAGAIAAATPGSVAAPPPGGGAGPGSGLTVTGVSGRTIMVRDGRGRTIIVRVSAMTTYSEAGAPTTLSDLKAGERIAVQAAGAKTGAMTLTATRVTVMLPRVMGRITAIGAGALSVKSFNGATVTIKTTAATRYVKASGAATPAPALKKGAAIIAEGSLSRNGKALTARRIMVGVPAGGPGGPPPPRASNV